MQVNVVDIFRLTQSVSILLGAIAVALADIFLKKAAEQGSLEQALRSPWLAAAILLYLLQIYIFIVAFVAGSKLSLIGILLIAIYALVVLAASALFYKESLTHPQMLGIVLAIVE